MADSSKKTKRTKKSHRKVLKTKTKSKEKQSKPDKKDEHLEERALNSTSLQAAEHDLSKSEEPLFVDPSVHMIQHGTDIAWGSSIPMEALFSESTISFEFQDLSLSDPSHIMLDLRGDDIVGERGSMMLILDSVQDQLEI